MNQDESGAPIQQLGNQPNQQPQQQQNPLGGIAQQGQPQQQPSISKDQVIAGLHHFSQVIKEMSPLLKSPALGTGNMRPKIFDASANLIGSGVATVPEIMNGINDLPDDPLGQKKWLEKIVSNAMMAEKKLISDYVSQQPNGTEGQPHSWSLDNHKDHMAGLMANYGRR